MVKINESVQSEIQSIQEYDCRVYCPMRGDNSYMPRDEILPEYNSEYLADEGGYRPGPGGGHGPGGNPGPGGGHGPGGNPGPGGGHGPGGYPGHGGGHGPGGFPGHGGGHGHIWHGHGGYYGNHYYPDINYFYFLNSRYFQYYPYDPYYDYYYDTY